MGRKKNYMDDGDDSSDDEETGRINFDITEDDLDAEMAGFSGGRQRQRKRHNNDYSDEDDDDMEDIRGGLGSGSSSRGGLGLGPAFLPAKTKADTTPASPVAPPSPVKKDPSKDKIRARANKATPPPGPGFAQFNAHSKGFGQKMLEKMGWNVGKGLGAGGEGIINPVETKLRPARMGLSFRGFDERTDQAKLEAKLRKGEDLSEEEEEEEETRGRKKRNAWKAKAPQQEGSERDTFKKPRKQKTVYRTAAEILAETEEASHVHLPASQQKVLDMTGPNIREISMSEIKRTDSPTLMETTTRLPELRHNLRLIVDLARGDLENLSREKQNTTFKMKSLQDELGSIQQQLDKDQQQLEKLNKVKEIASQLERISKDALATGAYENGNITALFGEQFDILERDFVGDEIKAMNIDGLVVSVWAPIWKYRSIHWNVLEEPAWGVTDVKRWKKLLLSNDDQEAERGWSTTRSRSQKKDLVSTPFETMMNTIWLNKVRSAINNQWDYHHPDPIIELMEEWEPVLPRFVYENIINQLVLPKITRAVSDWNPRTDPILIHTWVHPWFPTLKAWRLAELFTNIRYKLSVVLRQWHPSDESALHIITPWKDVWTPEQLETFTTKAILPKLSMVLRDEFEVNPRDQNMEGLIWCLAWKSLFSDTVFGQLLQNEFFNKWHHVLQKWLLLDIYQINYDQISDWYRWWRHVFDSYGLDSNKMVMAEFRKGLETMNNALGGEDLYTMGLSNNHSLLQQTMDDLERRIKIKGNGNVSLKAQEEVLELYIEEVNKNENIEDINIQKNEMILKYLLDKDNIKKINPDNYIFENGEISRIVGLNLNGHGLLHLTDDLYKDKFKTNNKKKSNKNMDDVKAFSEIKGIKAKKELLKGYIEFINKDNGDIDVQKNNLVLKTLITKLEEKEIDEENVIMKNNDEIEKINGIIIKDGLLILTDELYKNKKKKSNLNSKWKKDKSI